MKHRHKKSGFTSETTTNKERKKTTSATATAEEHKKNTTKAITATPATKLQTQSPRTTTAPSSTKYTLAKPKANDIRNTLGISTKPVAGDVRKKSEVATPRTTSLKTKTTTKNSVTDKTQTRIKTTAASVTVASKTVVSTASKNVKAKVSTQPLRAKHSIDIVEAIRRNAARTTAVIKSAAKPNAVLDTYHNVTVTSPPPKRREQRQDLLEQTKTRPRTRTLDADEVVILKSDSAKQRSEQEIAQNVAVDKQKQPQLKESGKETVKEPVAFEVKFATEEKLDKENVIKLRGKQKEANITGTTDSKESDEDAYADDDFESYESDFETGSSTENGSVTETESSSSSISSEKESEDKHQESDSADENIVAKEINEESDCEESELTQFPVTVIQRYKDHERKLDSGSYEIRSRQAQPTESAVAVPNSQDAFVESLDTLSTGASEQLDSGISNSGNAVQNIPQSVADTSNYAAFYGGFESFNTRPVITERGLELMSKIQFDTLTFILLDMKPISYEVFMQTYATLNTTQSSTQTQDQHGNMECQTDECDLRSIWTQHPPQYDLQTVQTVLACGLPGATVQNCCGEFPSEDERNEFNQQPCDQYDATLQALSKMRSIERLRLQTKQLRRLRKPVDCERLSEFLLRSAFVMSHVLNANNNKHQTCLNAENKLNPLSSISAGYRQLDVHFLNALQVVRIFANANHNLLLTVHACRPDTDVYRSDFLNLLVVWSTTDTSGKPLRLLSSWSEICRAEICQESANIVVCGLRDGSVAMWDLQETQSFCSKLNGHLTHFAATQSIVPSWAGESGSGELLDLGSVVGVRSFRMAHKSLGLTSGHKPPQFATLHESGILTIWSLVETGKLHEILFNGRHRTNTATETTSSYEFNSPWANVKLTQSAICDLHSYLQRKVLNSHSKFHKTKTLFEKNIYSDKVLRELGDTLQEGEGKGLQGLRFTSLDVGCERVYVCSSHNFIISCSKSLNPKRFDKIPINESSFPFPTILRVLSNEDFLAIGLSNGSVMILNCSQNMDNNEVMSKQSGEDGRCKGKAVPHRDTAHHFPATDKPGGIQKTISNERRSLERAGADIYSVPACETRPSTTTHYLKMINDQKKPFELRMRDQEILMCGSVLRQNLVQALELSTDGCKLFALSNGKIRVYDFFLDSEINENASFMPGHTEMGKVCDIAVASSGRNEQQLLFLDADNNIELHFLKP